MKEKLLQTARSYIGTPFKLHGRVKGIGCDCLGLVIGVARELCLKDKNGMLLAQHDITGYSIHAPSAEMLVKLDELFETKEVIEAGDLVLLTYDHNPQHLAIVGNHPYGISLIHAYYPLKKVVEHHLDAEQLARVKKVYRIVD